MQLTKSVDKKKRQRLEVAYYDVDAQALKEYYYFDQKNQVASFYYNFIRMHNRRPEKKLKIETIEQACAAEDEFRKPLFVIARKKKHFWQVREKIFWP